ncbi:MAG TPA: hypothetical protein VFL85_02700 [Candidatus Saccharimonadales bacterium]|nr:hypothetical protein [Candidatus Saccharimonadales bacterium]
MALLPNFSAAAKARKEAERKSAIYRALLHYEARIGGEVFGPIPKNVRREFFCLDEHTWVWHEEWTDETGKRQAVTTRYDVRPTGVVKSQGGSSYQALNQGEAQNLYNAIAAYERNVGAELQRLSAVA